MGDDGITCRDIDECLGDNECQHQCKNSEGTYHCECFDGYEMKGGKCVEMDICAQAKCSHQCTSIGNRGLKLALNPVIFDSSTKIRLCLVLANIRSSLKCEALDLALNFALSLSWCTCWCIFGGVLYFAPLLSQSTHPLLKAA